MNNTNKPSLCLVAFASAFMLMPPLFAQGGDAGNFARNPIIWADVPDLAAIRVGDTYYRDYLFNITWPRGGMRTVIVHRADKITGP